MVGAAVARALGDEMEVLVSTSGREALDRILAGEHFDRILCDVMMPGMGGAELLAEVERLAPRLRDAFVFMTGGAFTEGAVSFLEGHGGPLLEKPLDIAALRRVLHDAVP
jgi:CheY-like chemotaxis protein